MSTEKNEQEKRNAMMVLVARLRGMRCDKCKSDKEWAKNCQCDAAVKLREMQKVENGVVVKGEITVEKYTELKLEGFSDTAIRNDLGWHGNKFNEWKRENDLIGKKFEKAEVESAPVAPAPFKDWKILYLKSQEELEITKTNYGQAKKELEESITKVKTLDLKYISAVKDLEGLVVEYDRLVDAKMDEDLEKPSVNLELESEIERLKKYESDYRSLEVNQKILESKNKILQKSIERLKHSETMNLMMMERYLDLSKQLDVALS